MIRENKNVKYDVDLTYMTSSGNWYVVSWKGDISKSGGVTTNICIHFYDMLSWIFGDVQDNIVQLREKDMASGYLEFEKARACWFLSIDEKKIPKLIKEKGLRTYPSVLIDDEEIEFSSSFTEVHIVSYQEILKENGFGLNEARQSVEIIHKIQK